jgi:C-terminal processing protease CtpA/Prc
MDYPQFSSTAMPGSSQQPTTQVGLGIAIEIAEEGCTVLNTVVGGGAHSCGKIRSGDLLIAVLDRARSTDFVSTANMDYYEVRSMIIGAPGSMVTLKMQKSRSRGGALYLCEDLVRGTHFVASPPNPVPTSVRASGFCHCLVVMRCSPAHS